MSENLHDLYQAVILDHNRHPRHYGTLTVNATHQAKGHNALCGDTIRLYLRLTEIRIESIRFEAAACAICKASASIMAEALSGQTLDLADILCRKVRALLLNEGATPEFDPQDAVVALAGVRKFPARIRCAHLPWETYQSALQNKMNPAY